MMQGYMLLELLVVASIVCTVLAVVLRVCATAQKSSGRTETRPICSSVCGLRSKRCDAI